MEAGKPVPLDTGQAKTNHHNTRFFTEAEQQHVLLGKSRFCKGKAVLGHRVLSRKLLFQVVPKTTPKTWSMSFVAGAAKSQLALTSETGRRPRLGAVTPVFQRSPGVQSDLGAPTRSPVEAHDPAPWRRGAGHGRTGAPGRGRGRPAAWGQLVSRGPSVSFKMQ